MIPPAWDWLDLLHHIYPDTRGIEQPEAALPEWLVPQLEYDRCSTALKSGVLHRRVGHLELVTTMG